MEIDKQRIYNIAMRLLPILVFLGLLTIPVVAAGAPPNGGDPAAAAEAMVG